MSTNRYRTILIIIAMVGLAACADSGGDNANTPATTSALAVTTEAPPATEEPTTTTVEASEDRLVYVVMGNSLLFSTPAVMYAYRDILEEDLGVEVDMRDHTFPAQYTGHFLEELQLNDVLRADLVEADVILFLIPNNEWAEPCNTIMGFGGRDPAACGGEDGLACLRSATASYNALAEEIFAELTTLADPSETVIRVMDYFVFTPGEDDEATVQTLTPLWRQSQEYVELAAARYGIPVAQVFDKFMSPDGTGIPEQKGLVSDDGIHVTPEGSEIITQMIRELGYAPAGSWPTDAVAVTGQYPAPDEYIDGEQWGEAITGAGYEHGRGTIIRHADDGLSDDRVNGAFEALMDIDIHVDGDRTTGLMTMTDVKITNGGGTWEGTGVGTTSWTNTQPDHRHHFHFTLLGTGDYEGLQFRYHVEGINFPWTVTGTIEPVDG